MKTESSFTGSFWWPNEYWSLADPSVTTSPGDRAHPPISDIAVQWFDARKNGMECDSPSGAIPQDGTYTRIKGYKVENAVIDGVLTRDRGYECEARYDAGPRALAWMKQRDSNYVRRLMREGTLNKQEPNLATEAPELYQETIRTQSSYTTASMPDFFGGKSANKASDAIKAPGDAPTPQGMHG